MQRSLEPTTTLCPGCCVSAPSAQSAPCSGLTFLAEVVRGQFPGFPVPQSPVWVGGVRSPAWMFW